MTTKIRHIILAVLFTIGLVGIVATDAPPRLEGNLMLIGLTGLSWIFIFSYFTSPWRATKEGRSVMFFIFGFSMVCTQVMVSAWIGDYWARETIRPLTYLMVFVTMVNFELVRREGRSEAKNKERALRQKIWDAEEEDRHNSL